MAIRANDGKSAIIDPQDVVSFNVVGDLQEYGYKGELLSTLVSKSVPLVLPYEWELPDNQHKSVNLNFK